MLIGSMFVLVEVCVEITEFFQSGSKLLTEDLPPSDTTILPGDDDVVIMIKEVLENAKERVQQDGGDVQFVKFEEGIVYVRLQGSCTTCPSSMVTLKSGIERMMKHWVPDVMGVVAVDDEILNRLNAEQFQKVDQQIEKTEQIHQ